MIDLSFLTEAEQEAILKVLHRDAELKKAEDLRVRDLQDTVSDENELKYKSGQWFYDAKSKRHRDKIHGADLVRASIRKKKKPATIAELSQSSKDTSQRSWVNSINQDLFIPPELFGVMEPPDETEEDLTPTRAESNQSAKSVSLLSPDTDVVMKNVTASPIRQRKNPFNSEVSVDQTHLDNDMLNHSPEAGRVNGQEEKRSDHTLPIIKNGVKLPYPAPIGGRQTSQEAEDDPSLKPRPVPKPRKLAINGQLSDSSNSSLQKEDSFNSTNKRKGILKRWSSSSSTDSESIRIPQNIEPMKLVLPASPILEAEQSPLFEDEDASSDYSPDRQKQVRFSEKVFQKPPTPNPESYNVREVGEFGILEPSSQQNDLDYGFVDYNHDEEFKPTQYSYSDLDFDNPPEVLDQRSLKENPSVSLPIQAPSNSVSVLEVEKKLEDPSRGKYDDRVYENLDESYPEINIDSAGTEPFYTVSKKPSKSTSSDQDKGTEPLRAAVKKPSKPTSSDQEKGTEPLHAAVKKPSKPTSSVQEKGTEPLHAAVKKPSKPTSSDQDKGTEPLYAVVKKPSISTSLDQDKDFDMADALMEPSFPGQRGKIENTYQSEKPLEFGKSYSGAGKINFGSHYTTEQPGEIDVLINEDILAPERATNEQSSYDSVNEPKPSDYVAKSKRPNSLENKDLLEQPRTVQEFPNVNVGDDAEQYPENGNNSKYSPGENQLDTNNKSIFLPNTPKVEGRLEAPSSNFPVAPNVPLSSRPVSEGLQTPQTFLRDNRERDLPKSANFKVMSLKERSNDTPREQMSNPSQFQSLKHFWNVEDKNRSKGDASTEKMLTDVSKTNKPVRADFKKRKSTEIPADDFSLPSSFDSLSEEEQTSHKVASWLAQTPTVYGTEQEEADEDQVHPDEEVMENIDKTLIDRKNQAEEFSSALQKLTQEALEAPKITGTEHLKSKDVQISPFKEPDQKKSTTTILVNSTEKKHPATGFYDRVVQISSTPSPAKETKIVVDKPDISSKKYPLEEVEGSAERTVAPAKAANEFKIGFQKRMEENESASIKFDNEPQEDEPNLPNKERKLIETKEIVEKTSAPKGNDMQEFILALKKLEIEASTPSILEDQDEQPEKESMLNTMSPVKSSFKIVPTKDDTFEPPQKLDVTYAVQSSPPYIEDKKRIEEVVEKTTMPSRIDENDFRAALKKLAHEAATDDPSVETEEAFEKPKMTPTLQSARSFSTVQKEEPSLPNEEQQLIEVKENVERTSAPKGNDQQEFILALKKLEIEASTPLVLEDQDKQPEKIPPSPVTIVSLEKSSFKILQTKDTFEPPQKPNVTYTVHSSPSYIEDRNRIEEVEKTTRPSRKDEKDLIPALKKLENETTIDDRSAELDETYEKPKMTQTLHSTRNVSAVENFESPSSDVQEMPSPSHSKEKRSNLEDPYSNRTRKPTEEAKESYVIPAISKREKPKYTLHGKLPVEEEIIQRTIIDTQENSADYKKRLMRLEEEAAGLIPEDEPLGDVFRVAQAPTKEVFIPKNVFSSNESMPTERPPSMPKDLSQPQPYAYKELANYPQSPSDQSGSFTGSAGNVLCKKPDTSSEVSNSKKGKPARVGSPNDSGSSKHDKYAFEDMKAQDESISKVLDWFNRSSDSVDDQFPYVGSLEESKNTPQPIVTYSEKMLDEGSGSDVDNLVNGNEASQKMKSIPEKGGISESKEDTKTIDADQPKILNMTSLSLNEDESIPPQQVPLPEFLEFGNTGSGCGKIKSRSFIDDPVHKSAQPLAANVFETDKKGFEVGNEESRVLKEKIDGDDTEAPMSKVKDQTEVLTPTLEQSEDQHFKKSEKDESIIPQKRVSDIKQLWEGDKQSQDAIKKPLPRNIKRPFSPVELSVSPKSGSFDSNDQNSASLVTFKKVIVEDEEDPVSPVNQLKSFWENELNDTTKGKPNRQSMMDEALGDDKGATMTVPLSKFKKRHTIHNFFYKGKYSDLEKILPGRSVSLGESANESLKDRTKSASFQSLQNFWNVSSKLEDKHTKQDRSENKQFGSNPDISKEPFLLRAKSRLAANSLQDIREDPSAVSQFQVYNAEPTSRKFSKRNGKREDPQNSVSGIETEMNPSNTNGVSEKPISSVDVMLQESSVPSNYPKSSSIVSETTQGPDTSDEQQMGLTEVIEKSVAPERIAKSEISLRLKTLQDEVSGKNCNLSEEKPQSTTFESCPDDQTIYRDEENGEMNERGRKMFVKQSGFDSGSPIISNVSVSLPENEEQLLENDYPTGKDEVSDLGKVVNERIERTVIPIKKSPDFEKKLQDLYKESLNMGNSQNGNLTEHEYLDIHEPDQSFNKVLAVSSGNIQSSGINNGHQPIIINFSSKKTEVGNDDLSKPQWISPTETNLIRRANSADVPAVLGHLEQQVDRSEVTNITSEEPTLELKGTLAKEPELNDSETNYYKDNALQQEELSQKEITEIIEMPVVVPKTCFNDFDEKLKQLYEESQNSQPNLQEAAEKNTQVGSNVYLYSVEPKKTFLKSSTVSLESSQTLSADQETLPDESAPGSQAPDILEQEVNETIEKTVAPKRISNAKSLEKLQKESLSEEEGGFGGNVPSGHVALNESHSRLSDQALRENSMSKAFKEDTVQKENEPTRYEEPQEGTPETRVTFMSDRQSTPVEDKNGFLRRSTLELYLETPYRREISKSIDFAISGSDVNKYQSQPNDRREDVVAPLESSFPENAEKFKRMSQSVPSFLQDETDGRETDSASESSFQISRLKKSPSSLTNLSGSSGMASMSSVSGSVMSVYSGDFGNVDVKGNIEFAIDYVEQLKEFHIFIYQCKDLAAADVKKQRSDPYVKAYLLPEKAKMGKRKTAVKKKTLNPVYNEILRYKIPKQALQSQTLNLSVWHHDALGRNSFLGEVNQPLATWDWNNPQRNWYPLEARTPLSGIGLENRGEMKLSLKYIPLTPHQAGKKPNTTGEVHIWIRECIQLPMLRVNKINSFVKCTILPDTSRKSRQKTRTVDKTPNPIFNHTMVYDGFKEDDLREACVELTAWDHNKLTNHFIGGIRVGLGTGKSYGTPVDWMDSSPEESTMWEKMITSPNTWIDGMLPLRMFKMAKLNK